MENAANSLKGFTLICLMVLITLFYLGSDLDNMQLPTPVMINLGSLRSESLATESSSILSDEKAAKEINSSNNNDNAVIQNNSQLEKIRIEKDLCIPLKTISDQQMKLKKILVWHYAYGTRALNYGYGQAPFIYDNCEENRCYLTDDKTLLPVTDYAAVVFHLRTLSSIRLPETRSPNQRWIFYEMESASYIFDDPKRYNGLFNWTMTYRRDSDVTSQYGYIEKIKANSTIENQILPQKPLNKTKMAAWLVSNCRTQSFRENIVDQLQQKIQVDIYGKCGPFTCKPSQSEECYEMIENNYKFYLSFENSYCKDYVTEKFFNILRHRIVPVVYGKANYNEIAPPHSYIDVRDYKTSDELANYLIYLSTNDTAYNEYFEWKHTYRVLSRRERKARSFCDLCKKLHADQDTKIYTDIADWFVKKGNCTRFQPLSVLETFLGLSFL